MNPITSPPVPPAALSRREVLALALVAVVLPAPTLEALPRERPLEQADLHAPHVLAG